MKFKIQFSDTTKFDIREIWEWYETQRSGLGEEFLSKMESKIKLIQDNPNLFQVSFSNVRSASLERFPYKIAYSIKSDLIFVIGVYHNKRSSKFIRKRK